MHFNNWKLISHKLNFCSSVLLLMIKMSQSERETVIVKMRYDWWLVHKQGLGLCTGIHPRAIRKSVSLKFVKLFRRHLVDAPRGGGGVPAWRPKSKRNICHWILLLKGEVITLVLWHIDINTATTAQELFSYQKLERQKIFWYTREPYCAAI